MKKTKPTVVECRPRFYVICAECSREYYPADVTEADAMAFCTKCGGKLQKNQVLINRAKAASVPPTPPVDKWDLRFLKMAKDMTLEFSKDPSTKAGAIIVNSKRHIMSAGYNGLPRKVKDTDERYNNRALKYKMTVHAETNAIILAKRDLEGCTLYTWPLMPCSRCATNVIQAGITRCVAPPLPANLIERWGEDTELAKIMFEEAEVKVDLIPFE